ncbi:MAG: GAF domain-containing protein [Chloroflexota bacterium]
MTEYKLLHTEEASDSNANLVRNATWGAVLLTAAGLTFFAFAISLVNFHDWQDYILVGFPLLLAGVSLASIFIVRRGQIALGSGIVFSLNLVVPLLIVFILRDTFWAASSYLVISSALLTWRAMPRRAWRWSIIATSATLIVVVVVDLINPSGRFTSPAGFNVFITVVLSILSVAFIAQAARQAWSGNIRAKLLTGGIALILISVGTLGFVNDYNSRSNLTASSGTAIKSAADAQASAIGNTLLQETHILQSFALSKVVQDKVDEVNASYGPNQISNQQQIDTFDKQWRAADKANNDNDPLVSAALNSDVASELREFRDAFPENVEVFVTDKYGAEVAATNRTSDYYQADEDWWQAAYDGGRGAIYVGQPEFDQSSKTFGLNLAVPLYGHGTREVTGVLRTTININSILSILNTKVLNDTGRTSLYLPDGQVLAPETSEGIRPADSQALAFLPVLTGTKAYDTFTLDGVPSVVSATTVASDDPDEKPAVQKLGWTLVVHQSQADNLAPIRQQTQATVVVALIILAIGALLTVFLAQFLSGPIVRLTNVAEQISAGNNAVRAKVETGDEVGTLASTFNSMTTQLQNTLQGLEQRVADRTRNLELAAEVGRSVSQVRALDVMLKDACELILKEFNLYYVQVYLTDASQTTLKLEAGTGNVGTQLLARNHSLPLNTNSINGRAAVERRSVVISDTTKSGTFRQNPLLPNTRGEMAVPLIVADKVVGVLDMQSSESGVLNQEVLTAFEALAGQLAVAIQNANLVAETEQARAQVEAQARRLVRTGWNEHLDAIHKPEQLGFVFDHNQISPLADVDASHFPETGHAISASISVTGESLGSLVVEIADEARREQTSDLVNIVARQVAQQIENLRLLESAERYRFEAERAARLQTIAGWQDYVSSRETNSLGYLYNSNEVLPSNNAQNDANAMTLPVKVRDEKIGSFSIQGLTSADTDGVELANVVAERLGAHIESLRQANQTQSALAQSEKLFEASRRLTQSESLQDLVVAAVEALGIHEIDRVILGGLDYASTGDLTGMTIIANWSNRVDLQATAVGTHYPKEVLSSVSLFTSTKPLFINDMLNDERVDDATKALAKRVNYRAVAALPLYVGSRQDALLLFESVQTHAFTTDEIRLFNALAPQIATVLENRRQFERAQKQAERESMLNTINQKIQSATSVEAVLQIAARELGHALGAPMTVAQLSMKDKTS